MFLQCQSTATYRTNLEKRRPPHTSIADAGTRALSTPGAGAQEGLQASSMNRRPGSYRRMLSLGPTDENWMVQGHVAGSAGRACDS